MREIASYAVGQWVAPDETARKVDCAITGEAFARIGNATLNTQAMLAHARAVGGPALRKLNFHERAKMVKALAMALSEHKQALYDLSFHTGGTQKDHLIDIDGGIGTMFVFASKGRRELPEAHVYVDGDVEQLSRNGTFLGQHICTPLHGVGVHINAFNFPIWGMLEKIAVNLLAGVPAVVKPSEYTCYLTEVMVRDIIDSKILPEGALQLVVGLGRGVVDFAGAEDTVTFTGSAATGAIIGNLDNIQNDNVSFNLECDSLNAAVLGKDAVPGTKDFDIFIKEVQKEITIKAGQKCTSVRRVIVPEELMDDVQSALAARLAKNTVGDPADKSVRMGSLATRLQVERVRANIELLQKEQNIVIGDLDDFEVIGADKNKGAFMAPIVFRNDDPHNKTGAHNIACF
uniref:aldehyde dehydrogenase family protein n=1 Tax=uncultured Lentibacter sp. TaxID=1659309 RepID=UPI00260F30E0